MKYCYGKYVFHHGHYYIVIQVANLTFGIKLLSSNISEISVFAPFSRSIKGSLQRAVTGIFHGPSIDAFRGLLPSVYLSDIFSTKVKNICIMPFSMYAAGSR